MAEKIFTLWKYRIIVENFLLYLHAVGDFRSHVEG